MAIKKVIIEEGCISCGLCEEICPKVFKLNDEAEVIPGSDFLKNEECIHQAAEDCPVDVIIIS